MTATDRIKRKLQDGCYILRDTSAQAHGKGRKWWLYDPERKRQERLRADVFKRLRDSGCIVRTRQIPERWDLAE